MVNHYILSDVPNCTVFENTFRIWRDADSCSAMDEVGAHCQKRITNA